MADADLLVILQSDGTLVAGAEPGVPEDIQIRMLETMLLVRALDEKMLNLQRQGRIGFYGTARGQEATPIGTAATLRDDDWVFPALREGSIALWRGYSLEDYIAQCMGNANDVCKGHQMPCHYGYGPGNFVTMSSVIATQIPHAVGCAQAMKIKGTDSVSIGFMGDGATSEGDFHAAMNFAGVFKVPCVLICQNNQWAISVPVTKQTASETIAIKAEAYGMEGIRIDGNDAFVVYREVKKAVDKARAGGGPTFIETLTYRMGGHSSSDDPARYRDETITKAWEEKDPILRLRTYLTTQGKWSEDKETAFLEETRARIDVAIKTNEAAGPPKTRTIFEDVTADVMPNLKDHAESVLGEVF